MGTIEVIHRELLQRDTGSMGHRAFKLEGLLCLPHVNLVNLTPELSPEVGGGRDSSGMLCGLLLVLL